MMAEGVRAELLSLQWPGNRESKGGMLLESSYFQGSATHFQGKCFHLHDWSLEMPRMCALALHVLSPPNQANGEEHPSQLAGLKDPDE